MTVKNAFLQYTKNRDSLTQCPVNLGSLQVLLKDDRQYLALGYHQPLKLH